MAERPDPIVVLVEPGTPANVGFTARVLANFGLRNWVLLGGCGWRGTEAERTGAPARDVLEGVREVATLTGLEVADDTAAQHVFFGYKVVTFEDGSTMSARFEGTQYAGDDSYKGTFTYIGGTGRFAGIEGGGTLTGKNYESIGGSRAEFKAEYTLSSD